MESIDGREALGATAGQIAEEWANEAHAMMAAGLDAMDMEKVGAATALLNRAIALRDGAQTQEVVE